MKMHIPFCLLLLFLLCFDALNVQGEEVNVTRIYTTNEFITFLKSSDEYTGTIVYLESDMDFSGGLSEEFTTKSEFRGAFDGQGHVIRNLVARSSSYHIGLFDAIDDATIQNVVIDSSCSFTNNFIGNLNTYVGVMVEYVHPYTGNCFISNIVNMADVSFEGDITTIFIGGIIGCIFLEPTDYGATVSNCVSYGTVKHSGAASSNMYMGGIAGYSGSSSTSTSSAFIHNCLNYGEIINNGTTSDGLHIGGIIGHNIDAITTLVNCVSAGRITSASGKIGSIAGYAYSGTTNITHCLWTSDAGCNSAYGGESSLPSLADSSLVTPNSTTASELNEYAESNGWSRWLFNTNNASVTFVLNNREIASLSSQLILLSDFAPEDDSVEFSGWYNDPYYTEPFQSLEVTGATTLYGLHGVVVTVTFDMDGGDSISHTSKRVTYNNTYGTLPAVNKTGYIFAGWLTVDAEVVTSGTTVTTAADHTLTARWTPNNFTVTFVMNGGDRISHRSKRVTYNSTYGTLPAASRTGYIFAGWFTVDDKIVTSGTTVTTAADHTLTARWEEVTESMVEIVFGTKELSEEEAKDIIKRYTEDEFTIIAYEKSDESGEIKVIVKFTDRKTADNFIEVIEASSEMIINKISFIIEDANSFSNTMLNLATIFLNFMLI